MLKFVLDLVELQFTAELVLIAINGDGQFHSTVIYCRGCSGFQTYFGISALKKLKLKG